MDFRRNWGRMLFSAAARMLLWAIVSGVVFPSPGRGQEQGSVVAAKTQVQAPKSFEVASIKPSAEDGRRVMIGISPGGRYTARGVNVKFLIQQAYGIRDFQISGAPGWLTSERYDIIAKAETPDLNREKLEPLLRSLLAERFNLKFHRETKEMPIYALVVGKDGPKLLKSELQIDSPGDGSPSKASQPGEPPPHGAEAGGGPRPKGAMIRMGRGQVNAEMAPVSELASILAQQLGRPVVDKTGLEGKYDFKLEWTPDETMRWVSPLGDSPAHESAPVDSSGPSIFAALQEQLGLRLESQKGPVEILVIDHIEKASEN